jgi:uncharacterized protein (TIGR03000 family)
MYSIALLMALSSGNQAVDCHRHGGCCGQAASCCGCYGGGHHHGHRHHGCCCAPVCYNSCSTCNVCPTPDCGCGAPAAPHHEPIKAAPTPKATWIEAPATIVVELPADATLAVDGVATSSTSNVRVLVSPELTVGKEYQYTLTAQVVRDGKSVQVERNVAVRAGEESHVSLSLPVASVAQR